jgi:hypothetical protein
MRIDGSGGVLVSAAEFGFNLSRLKAQAGEQAAAGTGEKTAVSAGGGDFSLKLSDGAREAYEAYAVGKKKKETGLSTKDEFAEYMKKLKEGPKTKQERLDKLKAELKGLQAEQQETATNEQMPDEVKQPKLEALGAQIQHKMQAIADLTTDMSRDTDPEDVLVLG